MFQFPSNGKVYRKGIAMQASIDRYLGFNSLQTGKCIASETTNIIVAAVIEEFQFPSNGKVYRKLVRDFYQPNPFTEFPFPSNGKVYRKGTDAYLMMRRIFVSIPFKRESVSQDMQAKGGVPTAAFISFNSLQTGKCIASKGNT